MHPLPFTGGDARRRASRRRAPGWPRAASRSARALRRRRRAARPRPQPPRPARRPVAHARDGRVPRRRPPPALPRHGDGHDARAVLVLQRLIRQFGDPARGRRRVADLPGRGRVAALVRGRGDRPRLGRVRATCSAASSPSGPTYGTRTSGCRRVGWGSMEHPRQARPALPADARGGRRARRRRRRDGRGDAGDARRPRRELPDRGLQRPVADPPRPHGRRRRRRIAQRGDRRRGAAGRHALRRRARRPSAPSCSGRAPTRASSRP